MKEAFEQLALLIPGATDRHSKVRAMCAAKLHMYFAFVVVIQVHVYSNNQMCAM